MSRHSERRAAVEALYAADVRGVPVSDISDTGGYTGELISEVERRRGELDEILRDKSIAWTPERMSPVDRNILRVAVLELIKGNVPRKVAIDEAVQLAKKLSGPSAGRFVNGILDAVEAAQPSSLD